MASASTSLTCLALAGNSHYRDIQIVTLAQRCHKLAVLDLGWCTGLTDYGIRCVIKTHDVSGSRTECQLAMPSAAGEVLLDSGWRGRA